MANKFAVSYVAVKQRKKQTKCTKSQWSNIFNYSHLIEVAYNSLLKRYSTENDMVTKARPINANSLTVCVSPVRTKIQNQPCQINSYMFLPIATCPLPHQKTTSTALKIFLAEKHLKRVPCSQTFPLTEQVECKQTVENKWYFLGTMDHLHRHPTFSVAAG